MRRASPLRAIYVAGIAAVLAALIATGCAGSESDGRLTMDEYQAALVEIRGDYASTYERLLTADFGQKRLDELFLACNDLGEIMNDLTSRLQALNPPEEIAASHAELVDGLLGFKSFFHGFAAKIQALPPVQVEKLVDDTFGGGKFDPSQVAAVAQIDEALAELEDAVG